MPVAVSTWTLRDPDLMTAVGVVADAGFAGVEVGGRDADISATRRALRHTGLAATSVCPLLGPDRDLASPDPAVRALAVDAITRWVELAADIGAANVIVVPSDRPDATSSAADASRWAVDTLARIVARIPDRGPGLVLEPLNRYETHLVHTVQDAVDLCNAVGDERIGAMIDVFHAQVEEDDLAATMTSHRTHLRHVHLADNQRRAPGSGSRDFAGLRRQFDDADYTGTVALEFLPCSAADLRDARSHLVATGWEA